MKTLTISIDELELAKLDIQADSISFHDLKEKISIEYARESFVKCNQIASSVGLSELTMDEINAEIKAVRDAKNNR